MKIIWTNEAQNNLKQIRDYIAKDSVVNANNFIKKLVAAPKRLIKHPQSGRLIPELNQLEKREVIYRNYRIMYTFINDTVYITQVWHSARMLP